MLVPTARTDHGHPQARMVPMTTGRGRQNPEIIPGSLRTCSLRTCSLNLKMEPHWRQRTSVSWKDPGGTQNFSSAAPGQSLPLEVLT